MTWFHIFANLFNVWLAGRQPDSAAFASVSSISQAAVVSSKLRSTGTEKRPLLPYCLFVRTVWSGGTCRPWGSACEDKRALPEPPSVSPRQVCWRCGCW